MDNIVKQSLEENKDIILENLPEEFHGDFKASIESAETMKVLSQAEAVKEAEQCMRENPNVLAETRREIMPSLENDQTLGQPAQQASEAELKEQMQHALGEIEANLD